MRNTWNYGNLEKVQLSVTLWTIALQAPLSTEFSGLESWSGLPLPSPGDLSNPGIEPVCHTAGRFFTIWASKEFTEMVYSIEKRVLVTPSCPTLYDPRDCSPGGSSVHGILQAWILQWVAISFSRGSSPPRDQTRVSWIIGRFMTIWATREALQITERWI